METNIKAGSLWHRLTGAVGYCVRGVWDDTRSLWGVKVLKVANLGVRTFLDRDLPVRSAALTYHTVLALVPALAMLFAIARGFGFHNLLESQLLSYFPAQQQVLETALTYVDNYLAQASQGAFVGIGLVVLLWTLVALLGNVEDAFNHVWGVTKQRSLRRKFTDYTALFLIVPVLMVCSAGISIFMSDAVQQVFADNPLSPVAHGLLAMMPMVITWLLFSAAYYLIPNTSVRIPVAVCTGIVCGTLYQGLQWLFVTGQVYVSKYNAIYGSFAFLPLLLVWLQLSWLIVLAGASLTYAWQHYAHYAHSEQAADIAPRYADALAVAVLAVAVCRFKQHQPPLTRTELLRDYDLPGTLADDLLDRLRRSRLLATVDTGSEPGYQPAADTTDTTVGDVLDTLSTLGHSGFATQADTRLKPLLDRLNRLNDQRHEAAALPLPELAKLIDNP